MIATAYVLVGIGLAIYLAIAHDQKRARYLGSRSRFSVVLEATVGWIAITVYSGLAIVALVMVFLAFAAQNRALGQAVDIPEPCRPLARMIGLSPAPTREEAELALAELMKPEYDANARVLACRAALPKKRRARG